MSSRLTYVWASLKLRANVATNICSADASRATGATASAISTTWRPPRLNCMPSCSSGTKRIMSRLSTSVSSEATRPNTHVASHLPAVSADRDTGLTSSGSSDRRSRSPAVVSIATLSPPTNAATIRNIGNPASNRAADCAGVARSSSSTRTAWTTPGWTPRAIRRSALRPGCHIRSPCAMSE